MCGIAGYIGESKKPILTYQLITKLLEKSESRGIDAAGFWGTESGDSGNVLYHKEPGKASSFVKKDMWKQVAKHNPNLLLVHARGASKGVGEPHINQNNHPFTSSDKSVGLIHNGRVDEYEYQALKQKYDPQSQCDSEILLRIFESGETYSSEELEIFGDAEYPQRLAGIRDIYSLINEGHMAVAVGERLPGGDRLLWLFRNRHRPIWVVDMRDALGQVFFVSEPMIWEDAVRECSGVKNIARSQKLIELPVEEVWHFKITASEVCPEVVQRFEVHKEEELTPWKFDGKKIAQSQKQPTYEIITSLDEKDKVLNKAKSILRPEIKPFVGPGTWDEFPLQDLKTICAEIIDRVQDIQTQAEQLSEEQSISRNQFDQLLLDLDQQSQAIQDIKTTLEK